MLNVRGKALETRTVLLQTPALSLTHCKFDLSQLVSLPCAWPFGCDLVMFLVTLQQLLLMCDFCNLLNDKIKMKKEAGD